MEIFIFWEQSVIRYIYCVNLHTLHYVKYRNVHIPDVLCLSLFCYQSLYWLNFRLFRTVLGYQQASEPSRISRWREAMTGKMSAFVSWVIKGTSYKSSNKNLNKNQTQVKSNLKTLLTYIFHELFSFLYNVANADSHSTIYTIQLKEKTVTVYTVSSVVHTRSNNL